MPTTRSRTRELSIQKNITSANVLRPSATTNQTIQNSQVSLSSSSQSRDTDCKPLLLPGTDSDLLGLPSRSDFDAVTEAYIYSLSIRKQEKALVTQELFDDVWDVLHHTYSSKRKVVRSPQFRFWVRKMFTLSSLPPHGGDGDLKPSIVLHEGRPVALKSQLYDIIGHCHQLCQHGGRDRTTAAVKSMYSWVPKELVAKYVKICPTCHMKKTGCLPRPTRATGAPSLPMRTGATDTTMSMLEGVLAERTRTLPPLPPPPPPHELLVSATDSTCWLAHMVSQPGPSAHTQCQLPPIMPRSAKSENFASMRTTLPPLMQALFGRIGAEMQRVPFDTPHQAFFHAAEHHQQHPFDLVPIDPVLLGDASNGFGVHATTVELPRKVLVHSNNNDAVAAAAPHSGFDVSAFGGGLCNVHFDLENSENSDCSGAAAGDNNRDGRYMFGPHVFSSSRSLADIISMNMPCSASAGALPCAGQKTNSGSSSMDAQDWELSYSLETSVSMILALALESSAAQ